MPRASLSFGRVSIPVRLYNATEPAPGVRFRLLAPAGQRIRPQDVRARHVAAPIEEAWEQGASERATAPIKAPPAARASPRRRSRA
jgi:non-homologous end joining protein Ku